MCVFFDKKNNKPMIKNSVILFIVLKLEICSNSNMLYYCIP